MNLEYFDATYLVNRAYNSLEQIHTNKKKPTFPQPDIISKDRKTFFVNFNDLCNSINRTHEYVKKYIESEINISTSILGDGGLKFDVSIKPQQIKNLMTNFIKELIICKDCKSCITTIDKESRLTYLCCSNCNSKKSI